MTLSSNQFLEMLAARQSEIEDFAHEAPLIYGDIFKRLDKNSKTVNGQVESDVLMCCDMLLSQDKAKEYLRELTCNISAFEVHKNRWFEIRIHTENLGVDSSGQPIENIRRNKFLLILKSFEP